MFNNEAVKMEYDFGCGNNCYDLRKYKKFVILSVKERQNIIAKRRVCFRCLKVGHKRSMSLNFVKCNLCNGHNHHNLLDIPIKRHNEMENTLLIPYRSETTIEKEFPTKLPNNREEAVKAMKSHEKQLKRDGHMELSNDHMDELKENEFIQEIKLKDNEKGKPSPHLCQSTVRFIDEKYANEYLGASGVLFEDTYVDGIAASLESDEVASKIMMDVDCVLYCEGFKINRWYSSALNSGKSCVVIPVLGHNWDVETTLSAIARIWDPLGIVVPVLIELRIVFQSLWARGIDWDTVLEEKEAEVWKTKIKSLELLKEVPIIKSLRTKNVARRPEVHGFADGRELVYGGCVLVRWRLGTETLIAYVQPRVSEIQETFLAELFRFVPGKQNPADALTEHITVHDIKIGHQGPSFLYSEYWPDDPKISI
ncbi:unnamed protein product [Lepeophtheirus salmonis]|uniref:(salmon louse) hypothetical protein n=1 Tax=Lepeophtheirus salmonis TaxID=72036 RepID=A0A7R8CMD9_LEPSM|nr:unnamed protein product [Lepeophtheirus salmonis]CAF2820468.1 unnamed protein product [Lepeophtheirus salmonis]